MKKVKKLKELKPQTAWSLEYIKGEGWVTHTYTILGDKVVNKESTSPDLRLTNFEHFKRAVTKWRGENE